MHFSSLKNQLIEAYSHENLNNITSKIIALNNQKNDNALKAIASIINDFTPFDSENTSKLFTKLIMLYHPDKLKEYQQKIINATDNRPLQELMHIIQVAETIDRLSDSISNSMMTPEDFEEEYGWNYQPEEDDYYVVREDDETMHGLFDEENIDDYVFDPSAPPIAEGSFLSAVRQKIYGPSAINFPVYLLEDMEEIEMAEHEIHLMDGIEHCTYLKILDLSHNQIHDIKKLEHCIYVQELYLTDNKIYSIESLANLQDLRLLDLSDNQIEDISTLYDLPCLEFVNLFNNNVPEIQIDYLKSKNVSVLN